MLENSVKKHIGKLQQKKYRTEYSEFLIEGIKGVDEALDAKADILHIVILGNKRDEESFADIIKKAEKNNIALSFAGRNDIAAIQTTETYPGITAIVSQPVVDLDDITDGSAIICLDGIRDPGNLGTIIRSADWFGISHILLGEGSVDPYNEKVVRSTMGSIFRTNVVKVDNLHDTLKTFQKNGYYLASFEMEGTVYTELPSYKNSIYIFGSESHGVDPDISALSKTYTIPKKGAAESLNLGVSASIVMSRLTI